MNLIIHVDGGSRGNPGPAAAGVFIQNADTRETLHQAGYFLGTLTNNVAEYTGLLRSLEVARRLGAADVTIHSDSELMVRQLHGRYKVKSADLKPLYEQARRHLDELPKWTLHHVRREKNQEADRLANLAMDARADVVLVSEGKTVADPPASDRPNDNDNTLPCFSVTLKGKSGQCLAGAGKGSEYTFGPTTPDGCCIHAAAAALAQGPLTWSPDRRSGNARCRACGQTIAMQRLA